MSTTGDAQRFQVELRGVVDLLSRHIYSGPRVYLRELLQNAMDAVTARTQREAGWRSSGIRIVPLPAGGGSAQPGVFRLIDDGVGLTGDEVGELLATVGRSSKRDIFDLPRTDYLGQFGIGLLSCFMVSDEIVVRTRSISGAAPVEWVGASDGTFAVRELSEADAIDLAVGTEVRLTPRAGQETLLRTGSVLELAREFAEFLPIPIRVDVPGGSETVTRDAVFLQERTAALVDYGHQLLGAEPLEIFPVTVAATGTRGSAFVLPYAPAPGARQANRIYLGRMLITGNDQDLLPDWAFFTRVVVDSVALRPTASRESLVEDDALEATREGLGAQIRDWMLNLVRSSPERMSRFIRVHSEALTLMALHDDELGTAVLPMLSVETTAGPMLLRELIDSGGLIRYTETVDEFRQIAAVARADAHLVNGGWMHDAALVRRAAELFPDVRAERATVMDELDALDAPPLHERDAAVALEERAQAALMAVNCRVVVRSFAPDDLPALYVADPEVMRAVDRGKARDAAIGFWSSVMARVDELETSLVQADRPEDGEAALTARVCLNWRSPLVRRLGDLTDGAVFARSVQLIYIQSLLAGHRPLGVAERAMLTRSLRDLVELSVAATSQQATSQQADEAGERA